MLAIAGIAIFMAIKLVWGYDGDFAPQAQAQQPTALPYYTVVVSDTVTATVTSEPTADVAALVAAEMALQREIERIEAERVSMARAAEAALIVVTPQIEIQYEYVNVPYEVTRVVEVVVMAPTIQPTSQAALADGGVNICVDAAAVKELYIGGVGVVGGGCSLLQVGPGTTYITIQVNR